MRWSNAAGPRQDASNRGMSAIEQLSNLVERPALLPSLPHQGLLGVRVVGACAYFICNTPAAYAVISVLHLPVESALGSGRCLRRCRFLKRPEYNRDRSFSAYPGMTATAAPVVHVRRPSGSNGSAVPVGALDQQTFERALDAEQRSQRLSCRPDNRAAPRGYSLRLQYFENGRRCRDVRGVEMTGMWPRP